MSTPPPTDLPGLPQPPPGMTWKSLNAFKNGHRGADFYLACLQYGQELWRQRLPARAILCLDRAWGAELDGSELVLADWPLPYAPLVAILKRTPGDLFLGNPRAHFQHYADRLGQPRIDQRKWRSWACWHLVLHARPDFPDDPRHLVEKPTRDQVAEKLALHGHPGEAELWQRAFRS